MRAASGRRYTRSELSHDGRCRAALALCRRLPSARACPSCCSRHCRSLSRCCQSPLCSKPSRCHRALGMALQLRSTLPFHLALLMECMRGCGREGFFWRLCFSFIVWASELSKPHSCAARVAASSNSVSLRRRACTRCLGGSSVSARCLRRTLSVTAACVLMGRLRHLLALNHVLRLPQSLEKSYCVSTNPSCLQHWNRASRNNVFVGSIQIFINNIYF